MNNIFCTIFNKNYLDKGLVLIDSLSKCSNSFKLYVFAMDELTYNVLNKKCQNNIIPINVNCLEDEVLKKLRKERSFAEYCWTLTPLSIKTVINDYHEQICTYIDADMYFYCDPEEIIKEMLENKCNVQVVKHNFPNEKVHLEKIVGKYCVQFNTFTNEKNSINLLDIWCEECLNQCSYNKKEGNHGDQMYLSDWPEKYSNVWVSKNIGAGVAPWNTKKYIFSKEKDAIIVTDKITKNKEKMVFYHFQNLRYLPFNFANINLEEKNDFVKKELYIPYLHYIERKRKMLKDEFGIVFSIKKSSYKNPLLRFIQNYIMPFKIKRVSNIILIKEGNV